MHLDVEQVERWVDGELEPRAAAGVEEHLRDCAACREQVAEARVERQALQGLLGHLDHPQGRIDVHRVLRRARAHEPHWERWAAGVVLALGLGGAAYAIPGSPLPAWIHAAAAWVAGQAGHPRPQATGSPADRAPVPGPEPSPDSSVAGVAVPPGRDLVVSFTRARGSVRVSWIDGSQVIVRAPAGAAVFDARVDRLVIDNADSPATFEIRIPRTAPRVEIRVEERTLFLKEGSRVSPPEAGEATGPYLLSLSPARP